MQTEAVAETTETAPTEGGQRAELEAKARQSTAKLLEVARRFHVAVKQKSAGLKGINKTLVAAVIEWGQDVENLAKARGE